MSFLVILEGLSQISKLAYFKCCGGSFGGSFSGLPKLKLVVWMNDHFANQSINFRSISDECMAGLF